MQSTQTVAQGVSNHFRRVQEAFQRVWSDFQDLPKSIIFKTMGYTQAFCSKTVNFRPLGINAKSTQAVAQGDRNRFRRVQEALERIWSDFQDLPKSVIFKTKAFCSKAANIGHLRIQPKSTQTVAQGVRNHFRRVQETFQRVWRDFEDLPKSVVFKTMCYSPGFLLKNGQFSTLANCPPIETNSSAGSQKSFQKGIGGVPESLEGFRGLTKIGHFQNHGLQPRLFAKKRPIFDACELSRNRHKQWRKELEITLEGYRRRFRKFGGISRTYQNRSFSKAWAIAQAFCSKTANFRPLRIVPQSTQTVAQGVRNYFRRVQEAFPKVWRDFEDLPKSVIFETMGYSPGFLLKNGQFSTLANCPAIDTNSAKSSQKSFQKSTGGVSESQKRFRGLTKIGHVQNHGLQSRLFVQKRPNFDPCEFTRNQHKQSRKELAITLEWYRRRSRKFGGISRTYQNRSFSKPWAIAQAFCSKTANFRPLQIVPQSTQTVAQGVRNYFRRVQEAFPKVWRDFEDLPKSVIFKTMGYSPGFLLKNGQFSTLANCPAIDTNSGARSQKLLQKGIAGVPESLEGFRGLTKIGHFQNHGLQPRLFAQKRRIFDPCEFTRNQHKQSREQLEITLEGFRRRFREFGAISRTYQNRSCSKPWAIAQAFCPKTAKFRPLRIHPKST